MHLQDCFNICIVVVISRELIDDNQIDIDCLTYYKELIHMINFKYAVWDSRLETQESSMGYAQYKDWQPRDPGWWCSSSLKGSRRSWRVHDVGAVRRPSAREFPFAWEVNICPVQIFSWLEKAYLPYGGQSADSTFPSLNVILIQNTIQLDMQINHHNTQILINVIPHL